MTKELIEVIGIVAVLLQKLAWPFVAIVVFASARGKLFELADRLKSVKIKDVQLEITEQLEMAREKSETLSRDVSSTDSTGQIDQFKLSEIDLVSKSPVAAILEKWSEIEAMVSSIFDRAYPNEGGVAVLGKIERLRKDGVLTSEHLVLFTHLFQIRNIAVHRFDSKVINEGVAFEYIAIGNSFLRKLQRLNA